MQHITWDMSRRTRDRSRFHIEAALIDTVFTEQLFAYALHLVKSSKHGGDEALEYFGFMLIFGYFCYWGTCYCMLFMSGNRI